PDRDRLRVRTRGAGHPGLLPRPAVPRPHRGVGPGPRDVRSPAAVTPGRAEHRHRDGAPHRPGPDLHPPVRRPRRLRARRDRRGLLCQEHRRRVRGMGREPGAAALRRARLHGRVRGEPPVPRRPSPRHRGRHHGDPHHPRRTTIGVHRMTILRSTLDTSGADYAAAREAMEAKLEDLATDLEPALAGGGERKVARHRDRGKFTARERIDMVLDRESPFLELCALAAWGSDFQTGASVVAGIGVVEGVECLLVANDPTVKGGTSNPWTLRKILRLNDIAMKNRLPVISLVESGGADLPTQKEVFIPGGGLFRDLTRLSKAGIPTIAVVYGNSTAGGAYVPGMSDHVVMIENRSKVFLAGPPLVKAATGEIADEETLGGADMHARESGLADHLAVDEQDAARLTRGIVRRLGWTKKGRAPRTDVVEPLHSSDELLGIIPDDLRIPS